MNAIGTLKTAAICVSGHVHSSDVAPQSSTVSRAKDFLERGLTDSISRQVYVNVLSDAAKRLIFGS